MEKLNNANKKLKTAHESNERDYNTQIYELNYKENELLKRISDLDAKKLDIAKEHGSTTISDDDVLEINAGGKIIVAKRFTLTQLEGTRLSALFRGRWDKKLQRDNRGRIFLDVNPKCFQAIVDYLNELLISSEDNLPKLPSVDEEHEHIMKHQIEVFGLHRGVPGSEIVKDKGHLDRIHNWLEEDGSDGKLSLLYRGTRDGMESNHFHSKCDNKGPTLTIIETTSGIIMGGYSNTHWSCSGSHQKANKAFLYVLTGIDDGDISPPYKLILKNANDTSAVYHNSTYGPIFGDCGSAYGPSFGNGNDLFVQGRQVTLKIGTTYDGSIRGEYKIKEIEVYQIVGKCKVTQDSKPSAKINKVVRFSEDINEAINTKIKSLAELGSEIQNLEESFNDEQSFITSFTCGETKDIVTLNVSGTTMVTKRSTLCTAEESSLAQQFDDTKWTEQGCNNLRVKEWSSDEVTSWVGKIEGIPSEISTAFKDNEITGRELLTLKIEGLKMIGIERAGTLCLLLDEIEGLKKASQDVVTLIEHSPYCFGKILDYLRMKQIHSEELVSTKPPLPTVCDSQKERFRKVVQYFFPGDCAKFILGD